MPKRSVEEVEVEARTEIFSQGVQVNAPPSPAIDAPSREGMLTFSMYMTVRNVPVQEHAGRRAFTQVNEATLLEWNAIFKSY